MDEAEFEGLLQQAGSTTDVRAVTLERLVERTRSRALPRRRRRKPVVIGFAVAGAVLLAAAATSDHWTQIAPFMSLEDDMYRTQTAIPVDFVMTGGQQVHCQSFLEYKHLSVAQSQQADAYVEDRDWTGLGQRLYDDGAPAAESYEDAQSRIYDALTPLLQDVALEAVPTAVAFSHEAVRNGEALVNGSATICRRIER